MNLNIIALHHIWLVLLFVAFAESFEIPQKAKLLTSLTITERSRQLAINILENVVADNKLDINRPNAVSRAIKGVQDGVLGRSGFSEIISVSSLGKKIPKWLESISNESFGMLTSSQLDSIIFYLIAIAFESRSSNFDPFAKRKLEDLNLGLQYVEDICSRLLDLMELDAEKAFTTALLISTAASNTEYSLISELDPDALEAGNLSPRKKRLRFQNGLKQLQERILADDSKRAYDHLMKPFHGQVKNVDIIVASTGKELFADLLLAHTLINFKLCDTVTFHCRAYTSGGSFGAIGIDVVGHIDYLTVPSFSDIWAVRHFGDCLQNHIRLGSFRFEEDSFWCEPTPLWDMPDHIQSKLADSAMVFVKGDANYRRLLGERDWPLDTEAVTVLSYWPVPVCALRTFKAEIGCGISAEAQRRASEADPKWMVSGRWGVVQLGGMPISQS